MDIGDRDLEWTAGEGKNPTLKKVKRAKKNPAPAVRKDSYCRSCGKMLEDWFRFCAHCGKRVPTVAVCTKHCECGMVIRPRDRFCGSCGKRHKPQKKRNSSTHRYPVY